MAVSYSSNVGSFEILIGLHPNTILIYPILPAFFVDTTGAQHPSGLFPTTALPSVSQSCTLAGCFVGFGMFQRGAAANTVHHMRFHHHGAADMATPTSTPITSQTISDGHLSSVTHPTTVLGSSIYADGVVLPPIDRSRCGLPTTARPSPARAARTSAQNVHKRVARAYSWSSRIFCHTIPFSGLHAVRRHPIPAQRLGNVGLHRRQYRSLHFCHPARPFRHLWQSAVTPGCVGQGGQEWYFKYRINGS